MRTMKIFVIFVLSFFTIFIVNAQMPSAQLLLNGSDVGPEYTICRGSIILSTNIGDGTSTYYWQKTDQFGVTTELGTTPTISLTPVEDFIKYGVYVNHSGTVYYDTLLLTVNSLPEVLVLDDITDICIFSDVIINATESPLPSHTYQWYVDGVPLSDGGFYSGATTYQLTITSVDASLDAKRYDCRVTASYGCSAYARTSGGQGNLLQVNDVPTATFSPGTGICAGEEVELVVTPLGGTAPYSVNMNNGTVDLVAPNNTNPVINVGLGGVARFSVFPAATITYRFTITDGNGCSITY